ncbi:MAG: hypothetical protein M3O22_08325 [Pseudomonadota bacterium]|nr:hypothetical protein [Pseudomonadota bacterium]
MPYTDLMSGITYQKTYRSLCPPPERFYWVDPKSGYAWATWKYGHLLRTVNGQTGHWEVDGWGSSLHLLGERPKENERILGREERKFGLAVLVTVFGSRTEWMQDMRDLGMISGEKPDLRMYPSDHHPAEAESSASPEEKKPDTIPGPTPEGLPSAEAGYAAAKGALDAMAAMEEDTESCRNQLPLACRTMLGHWEWAVKKAGYGDISPPTKVCDGQSWPDIGQVKVMHQALSGVLSAALEANEALGPAVGIRVISVNGQVKALTFRCGG